MAEAVENVAGTEAGTTTEPNQNEALGTEASQATGTEGNEGATSSAELEALRQQLADRDKELSQTKQERNMLRNKTKTLEGKVLETDDLETIKEAYAELAKREEDREKAEESTRLRSEAEAFRDKVISEFPEGVQKAAKALIAKNTNNLIWEDAADWNEARAQLAPQLEALQEALGITVGKDGEVHENNPGKPNNDKKLEDIKDWREMRKILPIAPNR